MKKKRTACLCMGVLLLFLPFFGAAICLVGFSDRMGIHKRFQLSKKEKSSGRG